MADLTDIEKLRLAAAILDRVEVGEGPLSDELADFLRDPASHPASNEGDVDDDLISVTMTESAAKRFKEALHVGSVRVGAHEPPKDSTTPTTHSEWLEWGASRVALALHSTPDTERS